MNRFVSTSSKPELLAYSTASQFEAEDDGTNDDRLDHWATQCVAWLASGWPPDHPRRTPTPTPRATDAWCHAVPPAQLSAGAAVTPAFNEGM
jgi:hypothetical protein